MLIAINSYFLLEPTTGSGQHLYSLLEALDDLEDGNRYLLVYPRLGSEVVRLPPLSPRFDLQEVRGLHGRLGRRFGKLWWEQKSLPALCSTRGVTLLHSPYFASPLSPEQATVVTIHDVIPLVLRDYASGAANRWYVRLVSAAARKAKAIITVSQTSKLDIVRTLGIPEERVHVVYNAADTALHPVEDPSVLESVRESFGIATEFILYFGGFDVRKNVRRVIRAFRAALPHFDRPCTLVLAGALTHVGHRLYPDPRRLIDKLGMQKEVIVTGKVAEEDKSALYSAATAFIFPSLYEGFGMPVLEAMACGTPVITSNVSSLPEVAGDAALQVDPDSEAAMAAAMVRLFNDADMRSAYRATGLARAAAFSWEESAVKTLEVYRKAAS